MERKPPTIKVRRKPVKHPRRFAGGVPPDPVRGEASSPRSPGPPDHESRSSRSSRSSSSLVRQATQRAVVWAAQQALEQACRLPSPTGGTAPPPRQPPPPQLHRPRGSQNSVSSSSSKGSVRRGPRGRLFDGFDSDGPSSSSASSSRVISFEMEANTSSFPPSTNTESISEHNHETKRGGTNNKNKNKKMDNSTQQKRKKWSILKKVKAALSGPKFSLSSEISKEAWMCGVCAKSFSSFDAAERHEEFHIREVIEDLGFAGSSLFESSHHDSTSSFSWRNLSEERHPQESYDSSIYDGRSRGNNSDPTPVLSPPIQQQQQQQQTPQRSGAVVSFRTPTKKPLPDVLSTSRSSPALRLTESKYPNNTPALRRKRKGKLSQDLDDSLCGFFEGSTEYNFTTTILRVPSCPMSPIDEQQQKQTHQHHSHGKAAQMDRNHLKVDVGHGMRSDEHDLILPLGMRDYVVLADEALVDVCGKAVPLMLTPAEQDAERELELLAKDKAYYDLLYTRDMERRRGGRYTRFRTEGKSILSQVQNKFVDAYQLMKEGNPNGMTTNMDHYTRKLKGDIDTTRILENSKNTLYVNVIVKASLKVVRYELQRLAKQRWVAAHAENTEKDPGVLPFKQFRALARGNLVKLAELALASDFTPRRIAIQLSNDLYRLLTPRLKRRGVTIETEIEYRVGPYFVLAVNVKKVDWKKLVKGAYRDVIETKSKWLLEQDERNEEEGSGERPGVVLSFFQLCYDLSKLTKVEVMAQILAWCYHLHWSMYTPFCFLLYHTVLGELFRNYFLATVSDEIFYYVEQKGMEMDIGIRNASTQAAFMLSALRELRADGKDTTKKQTGDEQDAVLGPLLGPAIKEDAGPAPQKPPGFEMPAPLEFVGLELELSVGFRRLRWALLSPTSTFLLEAVFKTECKYENIKIAPWSKHHDAIGLGTLPPGLTDDSIVGAEREISYLMPKSAFVKANTCYETSYIDMYSDYCFVIRKKTLTPEVPYGSTFVARTKYVVINTGVNSCKLICYVEAEFPNGPPMISRQIKNGMRAGVGELFVKIGETITKYADHYP